MFSNVKQGICIVGGTEEATLGRPHLKGVFSLGPKVLGWQKKNHSGFSIIPYRKTQTNFVANPIDGAAELDSKSPKPGLRGWGTEQGVGSQITPIRNPD